VSNVDTYPTSADEITRALNVRSHFYLIQRPINVLLIQAYTLGALCVRL